MGAVADLSDFELASRRFRSKEALKGFDIIGRNKTGADSQLNSRTNTCGSISWVRVRIQRLFSVSSQQDLQ